LSSLRCLIRNWKVGRTSICVLVLLGWVTSAGARSSMFHTNAVAARVPFAVATCLLVWLTLFLPAKRHERRDAPQRRDVLCLAIENIHTPDAGFAQLDRQWRQQHLLIRAVSTSIERDPKAVYKQKVVLDPKAVLVVVVVVV
jgi:hypothetical protein